MIYFRWSPSSAFSCITAWAVVEEPEKKSKIIELDVCENCYTKVMSMLNDLVPEPKPRPKFEVVMSINFDDDEYTKEEEEKMNQEVIDALFPAPTRFHYFKDKENVPEACKNCHNHPINGGSGVCLCDAEVE